MADLAVWQRTIVDEEGNIVPGAEVEVRREEDGSLATLYADRAGETPLANPLAADMSGFVRFFAQGDAYTITAVGAGSTRTWRFDPTGRLQEFDRVSDALAVDDGADAAETRSLLGTFPTVADVQNSHIPPVLESIRTDGYYEPGDSGGALYKRAASEPSHAGKIQSADGAWWELAEERPTVQMFGASKDRTSEQNAQAFQSAIDSGAQFIGVDDDYDVDLEAVTGRSFFYGPGAVNGGIINRKMPGPHFGFSNGRLMLNDNRAESTFATVHWRLIDDYVEESSAISHGLYLSHYVGAGVQKGDSGGDPNTGYKSVRSITITTENYSDTVNLIPLYPSVDRRAKGPCWATVVTAKDMIDSPTVADGYRGVWGMELNVTGIGDDVDELRRGLGVVVKDSRRNDAGWSFDPNNPSVIGRGIFVNADGCVVSHGLKFIRADGGWIERGITFDDMGPGAISAIDTTAQTSPFKRGAIALRAGHTIDFRGDFHNGTTTFGTQLGYEDGRLRIWGSNLTERAAFGVTPATVGLYINGNKMIGTPAGGWEVPGGAPSRESYDPSTVDLPTLARVVKALIQDLHVSSGNHGLLRGF